MDTYRAMIETALGLFVLFCVFGFMLLWFKKKKNHPIPWGEPMRNHEVSFVTLVWMHAYVYFFYSFKRRRVTKKGLTTCNMLL